MDLFLVFLRFASFLIYYEVAEKCCPNDTNCCYKRFMEQKPLRGCEKLGGAWRKATICAEKQLNSDQSVQLDLDVCCKYLMPKECVEDCLQSLQSPTLNGNLKMSFTERCDQYNQTIQPDSCVSTRQRLAHECFPVCLRVGKQYNPIVDCPELAKNEDWCIGPEVPREQLPIAKRDLSRILRISGYTQNK